jgi:hypothetical protein
MSSKLSKVILQFIKDGVLTSDNVLKKMFESLPETIVNDFIKDEFYDLLNDDFDDNENNDWDYSWVDDDQDDV